MKKLFLSAASILALSAPVMAADIVEPAPFDWTGPYVGLNAGASFFKEDLELSDNFVPSVSDDGTDTNVTFGVQAGYNFQSDNLLLGVEGDFNYLDAGEDLLLVGKGISSWESDHDWFATIRARAGLVSDQTLFYITGGVAFLDADYELERSVIGPVVTASADDVLVGWTIGGGIGHAFSEDWSVKIEYLYADFESVDETVIDFVTVTGSADPSLHVVRAGLNYHF
jgi:outer membrane immunogenic protein